MEFLQPMVVELNCFMVWVTKISHIPKITFRKTVYTVKFRLQFCI